MISKENKALPTRQAKDSAPLSIGSTVEGKVVARDRSSLFIDLGILGTGIIYGREFYNVKDVVKNLNIGDKVYAKIVELENDDGYRELSLRDATKEISWQRLKELRNSGQILNVRITGVNKGGLLTSLDGIQAFLPVSQLAPEILDVIAIRIAISGLKIPLPLTLKKSVQEIIFILRIARHLNDTG